MNSEDQLSRSQKLLSSSSFCKEAYKLIVQRITSTPDKSQSKWIANCENYENLIKWDKSYVLPFYCTKETKLQTFQFKLLHRKIATNDYLHRIGISLTDKCTFLWTRHRKLDPSFLGLWTRTNLLAKNPTLVDTTTGKATGLFFDLTDLPGTSW